MVNVHLNPAIKLLNPAKSILLHVLLQVAPDVCTFIQTCIDHGPIKVLAYCSKIMCISSCYTQNCANCQAQSYPNNLQQLIRAFISILLDGSKLLLCPICDTTACQVQLDQISDPTSVVLILTHRAQLVTQNEP